MRSESKKRPASAEGSSDADSSAVPNVNTIASARNDDEGTCKDPPLAIDPAVLSSITEMSRQRKNEENLLPPHYPPTPPGLLFVLSGPSGVGKDAVISRLKEKRKPWHFTVTVTTRPMRPGEVDGVSYYFVSQREFEDMKQRGELLEWAVVHKYCYGTPISQVREALSAGRDAFLKMDVQGAAQVKRRVPDAVFIFLGPENMDHLIAHLTQRGTESPEQLSTRVKDAYEEMKRLPEYDYLVINREQQLEEAVGSIECIVAAEKSRLRPRKIEL